MPEDQQQLEGGAYEVIRDRLSRHGAELRDRLAKLNGDRKELFGEITRYLAAVELFRAEHCEPTWRPESASWRMIRDCDQVRIEHARSAH